MKLLSDDLVKVLSEMVKPGRNMGRVMRKPEICLCENKRRRSASQ